jgi:RimJ/RimL family protein N-acetyltransferase
MKVEPVVLENDIVRLEPLRTDHIAALCKVGLDPELWRWIPYRAETPADMAAMVEKALRNQTTGTDLPFVTMDRPSGKVAGWTRFMNIDVPNRRVEIGSTFLAPAWQRTPLNTSAKYLMLRHAFEVWKCMRVEFKTDVLNEKSRNAILRIGAKQEGIFRQHIVTWSGRLRDSVYFSIIDKEWPDVKSKLEERMDR